MKYSVIIITQTQAPGVEQNLLVISLPLRCLFTRLHQHAVQGRSPGPPALPPSSSPWNSHAKRVCLSVTSSDVLCCVAGVELSLYTLLLLPWRERWTGVDTGWALVSQGARRLGAPRIQSFSASPSPNWLWVALSRHVAPLRS